MLVTAAAFVTGCTKETEPIKEPVPKYALTATVNLSPGDKTLYYDIFVSNDQVMWLWVKRLEQPDIGANTSFSFDAPTVCIVSIQTNQKIYGASRETTWGNIQLPLDHNSTTIR